MPFIIKTLIQSKISVVLCISSYTASGVSSFDHDLTYMLCIPDIIS